MRPTFFKQEAKVALQEEGQLIKRMPFFESHRTCIECVNELLHPK